MILVKPSYEILTPFDRVTVLKTIEFCGRVCYKSEDKITENSASKFVKQIVKSGHHSVIEHVNLTVKFICDRGVSHELVRHRLAAYSQESTRYCNYKGGVTFIIPPWVDIEPGEYSKNMSIGNEKNMISWSWYRHMLYAEMAYLELLELGQSPQQARSVLPNSLKTEIVMTANLREWRHVFNLRCSPAAHPQMKEIMCILFGDLSMLLPEIFDE